jgi:hypothetical protein
MNPRTQEEFDAWFAGGDPWDYHSPFVLERLRASLCFLTKYYHADFNGTFVEFGAYNGDFTRLLSKQFPKAKIIANDISSVAIQRLKKEMVAYPAVDFFCSDMLTFEVEKFGDENGVAILLMEILYYMSLEEQNLFLQNLSKKMPYARVFISAPVSGGKYYNEPCLFKLFAKSGYICQGNLVLNLKQILRPMRFYLRLSSKWGWLRRRLAHQVLYLFSQKN